MQPSHIFYSILWNLDFSDIPSLDCKLQIVGLYKVHCDPTRLRWKATQRMHFKHCAWIESSLKPPNTIFGWGMYFPWDAGLKDTKDWSSQRFWISIYYFSYWIWMTMKWREPECMNHIFEEYSNVMKILRVSAPWTLDTGVDHCPLLWE